MENKQVKIVRLKDGVDIVCYYELLNNHSIEVTCPMMFEIRSTNLHMMHWLPTTIIKNNSVILGGENILCVFDPSNDFTEYYIATIDKLSNLDRDSLQKDKEESKQILDALSELETSKGISIH